MITIFICLLCGIMIVAHSGQKQFNWFVCSILLLTSNIMILDSPQVLSHRFFILCYWASILFHGELKGKKFPLAIPLAIYAIGQIYIGWQDKDLTSFYRLWKPSAFLLDSYFIILLSFWGTKKIKIFSRPVVYVLFGMTIYGILTYFLKTNPIYAFINPEYYSSYFHNYCFGDRTRISSTWSHPIAYGLVCSIFAVLLIPNLKTRREKILLALLVVNILICGSRTAFASFLMMLSCYALFRYKFQRAMTVALRIVPFLIAIYLFVPPAQEKVDQLFDTVTGESTISGSSLEMRQMQTASVLMIYSSSPIWGHGPDYIQEKLRSNKKLMNLYTTQGYTLLGFESYSYIILIERGLVGVVLELFWVLVVMIYAFRCRKRHTTESANILSIMGGFLFFALSTGALDTWTFTMLFVGLFMRRIHEKRISYNHTGV